MQRRFQYGKKIRNWRVNFSPIIREIWPAVPIKQWKELGEFLQVKYLDGNLKQEKDGEFLRNPWGYPQPPSFPGYSDKWKENVIKDTGERFVYPKSEK